MQKLAVYTQKGGVGKSTISVQLSHGLALAGYQVLLVDMDNQNNCSLFLGISEEDYNKTFFNLIDHRYPAELKECIIQARENLDLLPNSRYEAIKSELNREPNQNSIFDKYLNGVEEMGYDYIIFDCSPAVGVINNAVLYYVDDVVMPVETEVASIKGARDIYKLLHDLGLEAEKVSVIIPNKYDQRRKEHKENLEKLQNAFSDQDIISEPVHSRTRISEAGNEGKTIFEYDKKAKKQFHDALRRVSNL